jgi:hypothetical protein
VWYVSWSTHDILHPPCPIIPERDGGVDWQLPLRHVGKNPVVSCSAPSQPPGDPDEVQGSEGLVIHNWGDPADVFPTKLGTQSVTNVGHIGSHDDDAGGSRVGTQPKPVADHAQHQIWPL